MSITLDYSEWGRRVDPDRLDGILYEAALEAGLYMKRIVKEQTIAKLNKHPMGTLDKNWHEAVFSKEPGKVTFGVTNPLNYAGIHNLGKNPQVPTTKKNLAIPLDNAARQRGWPKDWGDELQFAMNPKTGKKFLVDATPGGKRKKSTRSGRPSNKRKKRASRKRDPEGKPFNARFILVESVVIPATHYLDETMKESLPVVGDIFTAAFGKGI